jgi:metal-responsive CopG/Arc/MetJ family transcriptional regulator
MKTAISLPDTIFTEADRFAKRKNKSRSQLYAEAIEEYLYRHNDNEITNSMNSVVAKIGNHKDTFYRKAAQKIIEKESW